MINNKQVQRRAARETAPAVLISVFYDFTTLERTLKWEKNYI